MDDTKDELQRYFEEGIIALGDNITPLQWWCDDTQRSRFPFLSKMAIDILSIPAMSSEAERVFSSAKRCISDSRYNLSAKTIGALECLKSWLREGLFTEQDFQQTIQIIEEGMELEQEQVAGE